MIDRFDAAKAEEFMSRHREKGRMVPDCVPTNVREWEAFADGLRLIMPRLDTAKRVWGEISSLAVLPHSYKRSVLEVFSDRLSMLRAVSRSGMTAMARDHIAVYDSLLTCGMPDGMATCRSFIIATDEIFFQISQAFFYEMPTDSIAVGEANADV